MISRAGRVVEATSPEDFISKLTDLTAGQEKYWRKTMYRGHASTAWSLTPAAFRTTGLDTLKKIWTNYHVRLPKENSPFEHIDMLELNAVALFYSQADRQGLPLPPLSAKLHMALAQNPAHMNKAHVIENTDWPQIDLWPVFALAQHYGIPTRLLDWSADPFVAAYFAAVGALAENGADDFCVWTLSETVLARLEPCFDHEWNKIRIRKKEASKIGVYAVDTPRYANPNLYAQKGRFTLVVRPNGKEEVEPKPLDLHLIELFQNLRHHKIVSEGAPELMEFIDKEKSPLFAVVAKKKFAGDILGLLRQMDYSHTRIFPGYEGCAKEVLDWK
ncbi:FRG domain-containing protein [Hyphomonas jannaschiana]|uniref:FRG domain-containing protein n=1 Tax=Hyphomonas jannaschiana TaxID=86 RepID=UPI0035C70E0F